MYICIINLNQSICNSSIPVFSADFKAGEASLRVCHDHMFHEPVFKIRITSSIRISKSASAEKSSHLELDWGDSGRAGRIDGLYKRIGA